MTSETIQIPTGDLTFDAVVEGPADGPPVLLLHGFPQSSFAWRKVQPRLAEAGYRTLAPDQRGYSPGASPADPADYAIASIVADALAMVDESGWDSFHLVGHDWGGVVAWHLAARAPERVRTLTSVSTPHPRAFQAARAAGPSADGEDQREKSSYVDTFRAEGAEELLLADDQALFRMMLEASGLDQESAADCLRRLDTAEKARGPLNWYRGAEPWDADGVGPTTVPTLYVWSTEDIALGRTAAELTGDHVSGPYRFEVLEGVSHWVPEMAADRLVELVLEHLSASG